MDLSSYKISRTTSATALYQGAITTTTTQDSIGKTSISASTGEIDLPFLEITTVAALAVFPQSGKAITLKFNSGTEEHTVTGGAFIAFGVSYTKVTISTTETDPIIVDYVLGGN